MAKKEAQARIKINNLLQESGWRFFDKEGGSCLTKNNEINNIKRKNILNLSDSSLLMLPIVNIKAPIPAYPQYSQNFHFESLIQNVSFTDDPKRWGIKNVKKCLGGSESTVANS